MTILVLDTALSLGWAALLTTDKQLVAERHLKGQRLHSISLAPVVEALLADQGVAVADLEQVLVGIGPGSYTGIRVAAALAAGFQLATEVPLAGFCSLSPYFSKGAGRFATVADARGGGVYLRIGQLRAGELQWEGSATRYSLDQFAACLADLDSVVSPDRELLQQRLENHPIPQGISWESPLPQVTYLFNEPSSNVRPSYSSSPVA